MKTTKKIKGNEGNVIPSCTIDKNLDKFHGKVLFPKKMESLMKILSLPRPELK